MIDLRKIGADSHMRERSLQSFLSDEKKRISFDERRKQQDMWGIEEWGAKLPELRVFLRKGFRQAS